LWPVIRSAARQHADDFRPLTIRTEAPPMRSSNAQIQLLQKLQRERVRGVCVDVDDPEALAPALEALRSAGVVVVTMRLPVPGHTPFLHSGIVAQEAGALLADLAAEALQQHGTLALVVPEGLPFFDQGRDGFERKIATYSNVQMLPTLACPRDTAKAQRLVDACAQRFPRLDAWALLDARLLEPDAGTLLSLPAGARFVTLGMTPAIRARLADGTCAAAVEADYNQMVVKALELCAMTARGLMTGYQTYEVPLRAVHGHEAGTPAPGAGEQPETTAKTP
jgi:ABC-type sugar transport system substrate-binding protein